MYLHEIFKNVKYKKIKINIFIGILIILMNKKLSLNIIIFKISLNILISLINDSYIFNTKNSNYIFIDFFFNNSNN